MSLVLLGLGSNVGDALGSLRRAVEALSHVLGNLQASSVYRTAPMYNVDQAPFLNAAVSGDVSIGPLPLLKELKNLEQTLGRQPRERNGPREIDIDLIAYGNLRYVYRDGAKEILVVPHPKVVERRFVLQPIYDLRSNALLPGLGTVDELLKQTNEQVGDVVRLEDALLPVRRA